ncbi:MAG TPA: S9 family peptidase [Terriglobales bacterium]
MLRRIAMFFLLTFFGCIAIGQNPSAQPAARRPFSFEDMMALKRVEEPVVSPDGKWIIFSAVDVSLAENTRKPYLWIVPSQGGDARRLTVSQSIEDRGRFSPDGSRILYLSDATGGTQIWIADFDSASGALTGPARQLTSLSTEADGAIWSPDGKNILFLSEVYPECPDDACNKARDEEHAKSKVKALIFNRLFYRHWTAYTKFKRTHLLVVPAEGGTPKDITPGDHDVPPFNLGGQDLYAISPDGQEVAYTSNIDEVEATSTNNEVFVVPIAGGTPRKISTSPGSDSTPLYSPDGKYIAYRSQARAGYESDRFRLLLFDRQTQQTRELTQDFDLWVGTFTWSPDSSAIYFSTEEKGESPIYVASLKAAAIWRVVDGHDDDLAISRDGKSLFFTRMSIGAPNEIYMANISALDTSQAPNCAAPSAGASAGRPASRNCAKNGRISLPARQITHMNDALLSQIAMQPLLPFWFFAADKTKVEGFIVKPPNFDPAKKYPVKFLIHGGPEGDWGDAWSYRWNPELFAANGYVIVMINPRGSTGYGQKFIDQINGDWGGKPYSDLMRGLDHAESTFPFINKDRECALGASYGGYMINWLLGHTNRFKCMVSHDGMFNTESAYGTTEELWFNEWEFKGTPWTNRQLYRKWSPHLFASNFKTPTLVVHGQLDYRLDLSEGLQLFTTLQRLKVPSRMLYFPDEGHWVLKPQNSRLWYKTVNDWVDTYIGK